LYLILKLYSTGKPEKFSCSVTSLESHDQALRHKPGKMVWTLGNDVLAENQDYKMVRVKHKIC